MLHWWPVVEATRPNTVRRYLVAWTHLIAPQFGHRKPREITRAEVQEWANALLKKKAVATVRQAVGILSSIYNECKQGGDDMGNPAEKIKLPRIPKRKRVMTMDQLRTLLASVEGTPLAAPVFLGAVLGMRRGEMCGLKWENVDLKTGRVRITEQRLVLQKIKGKGIVSAPLKSEASERSFVLPKQLTNLLQRVGDMDSGYVCTNERGKPWNPEKLTSAWAQERAKLGFEGWHLHDLRHVAGGILAGLGVDLLTIAAILGHSSIDVTQLYAAAQEATATKGLGKLGRALSKSKKA